MRVRLDLCLLRGQSAQCNENIDGAENHKNSVVPNVPRRAEKLDTLKTT